MPTPRQDTDFSIEMNGYTEISKQSLRAAIEWMADNLIPEEIFDDKKLQEWAESNGYVKE